MLVYLIFCSTFVITVTNDRVVNEPQTYSQLKLTTPPEVYLRDFQAIRFNEWFSLYGRGRLHGVRHLTIFQRVNYCCISFGLQQWPFYGVGAILALIPAISGNGILCIYEFNSRISAEFQELIIKRSLFPDGPFLFLFIHLERGRP